jgi:hypothetical protein
MHLQIRANPKLSPPDIEKLLRRLKDDGVNLAAAGGSNVEFGGEFAFAVDDGQEDQAFATLNREPRYEYRVLHVDKHPGLTLCWLQNEPGALHACVAGVAAANLESGRVIRDLLIGVPTSEGIPVHVYSEEVRTRESLGSES